MAKVAQAHEIRVGIAAASYLLTESDSLPAILRSYIEATCVLADLGVSGSDPRVSNYLVQIDAIQNEIGYRAALRAAVDGDNA